jgi:hypothetical protein
VDPEEEAQLEVAAAPTGVFAGTEGKDFRVLAAGTAQNIIGLGVFVIGTFAANILIARSFGGGTAGATASASSHWVPSSRSSPLPGRGWGWTWPRSGTWRSSSARDGPARCGWSSPAQC